MERIYKCFFTLVLSSLLIFNGGVNAQSSKSGVVSGKVVDQSTSEELIGATILLKGTNNGTVTDLNGNFRLTNLPNGLVDLEVRYIGYETATEQVDLSAGNISDLIVKLNLVGVIGEDIIITAQAEGQIAAINKQLASNTIENVVSAKKIQEVPDANAAESLGRLPGVSILRSGGEGSKVVIRGLAPKFNKVQVEGVKMAATGSDDRSSDLSMISPYMLEAIEVSKAAMADKEADALGGNINFVMREAPEGKKLDVLLQTGFNQLNSDFNNQKFVLGGSNRFFNDKLGVFAQIDLERRARSSDDLTVDYGKSGSGELEDFDISTERVFLNDYRRNIKRGGATVVVDYRLPAGSIKFSNFGSLIKKNQINRYEIYENTFHFHRYGFDQLENDIRILTNSLKIRKDFGAFTIFSQASYSFSDNVLPDNFNLTALETNAFSKELESTAKVDEIINFAKNDFSNANIQQISKRNYTTKENEYSFSLDLQYLLNVNDNLNMRMKTGIKYKKLFKDYKLDLYTIPIKDSGHGTEFRLKMLETFSRLSDSLGLNASKLPYNLFVDKDYGKKEFINSDYYVQGGADVDFINEIADLAEDYYFYDHAGSTRDNYNGTEDYKAAYFLTQFDIGKNITFIPGLRFESNETEYTGNRGDNTVINTYEGYFHHDTTLTRKNNFLLPMIHLRFKFLKGFDVRMAYTHTIARPSYNQIIPKWDISLSSIAFNNPYLVPALSKNIDLQFSAYRNKLGLISLGGFYKQIDDLIFDAGKTIVKEEDVAKHSLPESYLGTTLSKVINNPNTGVLYGLEFEWQTRFWYLDNFLKGVVLNINYTHTFSDVDYERTILESEYIQEPPYEIKKEVRSPYSERLIYQPTSIFNLTLGYDYKDFSSRISFLYQNDIFSRPNFFRKLRGATDNYYRLDLNMKQKLPWKGFELLMNFSNLTSTHESNSLISTGQVTRKQYYGFTIDLGLRYRL